MTEQELEKDIKIAINEVRSDELWRYCFAITKAYADARVAQEIKVLDELVVLLNQTIATRNSEITELKTILTKILALPDDTSAAYIKALIHDQLKTK